MLPVDGSALGTLRPLVPHPRDAGHMAFVYAVLDGTQPGRAWAGPGAAPERAIVVNDSGFAFAVGQPAPEGELRFALSEIIGESGSEPTTLFATSDGWRRALGPLFARYEWRNEYHYEPGAAPPPVSPPTRTACAFGGPTGCVEAEIEIGTAPRFRGSGLAEVVGRAFIAEAERRGFVPSWTCAAGNLPSARLAERLGFRFTRHVVGFPLDRSNLE